MRAPPPPSGKNSQMEIQTSEPLQFAQRLSDTAINLVGTSHIELTSKGARDPKIVALSILCRTICNFRGAILLVQQESIVEARALIRLIYENFLWVGALRERGEAFVDDMLADEAFNRKALAQLTLHMSAKHGGDKDGPDTVKLRSLVSEINKQFPVRKKLHAKETASTGDVELAYVEYARLSLDAVHCSITALGRHLSSERTPDKTELILNVVPQTTAAEVLSTIAHACNGLIGVAIGTNEMLGVTAESSNLGNLMAEFEGANWTRDALHFRDAADLDPKNSSAPAAT